MNASGSRRARMAMYSVVHRPIPGSSSNRRRASTRSAPASIVSSPPASALASASRPRRRPVGIASLRRVHSGDDLGCGEHVRDRAEWTREWLAVSGHEPAGERAGALQRDLLSEHRANSQFVSVDGIRARADPALCSRAARAASRRREQRPRCAGRNRGRAARASAASRWRDRADPPTSSARARTRRRERARRHPCHERGAGCADRSPRTLLDAGHGAKTEEGDQARGVERRAIGQAQRQRAAVLARVHACACAHAARLASSRTPRGSSR